MNYFILRNVYTGWQGSVTEAMYHRLIAKDEYMDPRLPGELLPEQLAVDVVKDTPKPTPPPVVGKWTVRQRSPGWYDVVRGSIVKNDRAMRKAAAEALRDKLNDGV